MRKFICVGLISLITVFGAVPAYAFGGRGSEKTLEVSMPQFKYISALDSGLSINSSGLADCEGSVSLYDSSYAANLSVLLQKYTNGGWMDSC